MDAVRALHAPPRQVGCEPPPHDMTDPASGSPL